MTHNVDCTVRDEFRDEIQEIAEVVWDDRMDDARVRLNELGWNEIGGGVGRWVWSVPPEEQAGEVGSPTEQSPCVVKFATPGHRFDGRSQNREEIRQFRNFPPEIAEADPPVIVPVRDWDRNRSLWLTMPEVNEGGGAMEVERRLAELGWQCNDLHHDNIGEIHGVSVALDYGLDCTETTKAGEIADEVEWELDRLNCRDIEIEPTGNGGYTVYFLPPAWATGPEDVTDASSVSIDPVRGPMRLDAAFGQWDDDEALISEAVEQIADTVEEQFFRVFVRTRVKESGGNVTFFINTEFDVHPQEQFTPDIVGDIYDDILDEVSERFDGTSQPEELVEELRDAISDDASSFITEAGVVNGRLKFYPDDVPGGSEDRSVDRSVFLVNSSGVTGLELRLGPWDKAEPTNPPVPKAATGIATAMSDSEVDVKWSTTGVSGTGLFALRFVLNPTESFPEDHFTIDRAAELYRSLLDMIRDEVPKPRDAPGIQKDIGAFVEQRAISGRIGHAIDRRLGR